MKTICMICGKKGYKKGKPCTIDSTEFASHILCSKKCIEKYETEYMNDDFKIKKQKNMHIFCEK